MYGMKRPPIICIASCVDVQEQNRQVSIKGLVKCFKATRYV